MKNVVHRNMVFISAGKSVSLLGSSVYTFAMSLYVLKITGSALTFAVTLILGTLPVILVNPLAGVIADRGDKKLIVVIADLLNGIMLLGLLLYSMLDGLGLTAVYLSTFILNVITVVFDITLEAAVPDIVTGECLLGINSISKTIESAAAVLGPLLGGIIYAFVDIRVFIFINAISFVFSSIMEFFVDFNLAKEPGTDGKNPPCDKYCNGRRGLNITTDIGEGISYLKGNREITGVFLFLTGVNFLIGFSVLVPMPFIINNVLFLGSVNYGIIQAAFPIGAILGALLIKRRNAGSSFMAVLIKAAVILSCSVILISIPVFLTSAGIPKPIQTAYYCVILAFMGSSAAMVDISLIYMLQTKLPGNIRGRVLSLGMSLVKAASPLAFVISGILLGLLPGFVLPFAGGALLMLYSFVYGKWAAAVESPVAGVEN